MTKREAKAVELYKKMVHTESISDEELLQTNRVQCILEAMQWMAEQCASEGWLQDQGEAWAILNAGKENV